MWHTHLLSAVSENSSEYRLITFSLANKTPPSDASALSEPVPFEADSFSLQTDPQLCSVPAKCVINHLSPLLSSFCDLLLNAYALRTEAHFTYYTHSEP